MIVCFLWALIFNSAVLHAQDSVVISARIVNAQAQPVERASISLYRQADQTLLGRTISDRYRAICIKVAFGVLCAFFALRSAALATKHWRAPIIRRSSVR